MNLRHALVLVAAATATLSPPHVTAQTLTTEIVASGLTKPIYATAPSGDFDRVFVAQQNGVIRVVRNGSLLAAPFLSIPVPLTGGVELGLLSIAFDPDYETNGYLYVNYTRPGDNASVVSRFTRSATNPDRADASSEVILIGPVTQPHPEHNFGWMDFGPDGYLYVSTGDGGDFGDPGCNAQNGASLLGKILRIDRNGNAPASNPFVGNPAFDDRIWAYGLRNPWRCSFDRATGDLWIADVGQSAQEEINFQPASSAGGHNYGWKLKEGLACFAFLGCTNPPLCTSPMFTDPIRTLPTPSNCAIIGGYVYRGCAIPALRGTYFHADWCSNRIYSFRYSAGAGITELTDRTAAIGTGNRIASFGEDAAGELLMCGLMSGEVHRIVPTGSLVSSTVGPGSVGSNGITPAHDVCGRLNAGQSALLRLRGALPNSTGAIMFALGPLPIPLPLPGFGTLVPGPITFQIGFVTDASGSYELEIPGGAGGGTLVYHQAALVDLGLIGVTLSNAVATVFD